MATSVINIELSGTNQATPPPEKPAKHEGVKIKDTKSEGKLELDPVLEVDEDSCDKPYEFGEFVENPPRIFGQKTVLDGLTLEGLNNAIYEQGVVNLCWPEITEPVFETRTCFPPTYYTNSTKERLLLAYAESFRRQFHFHYKHYRKPLLLQAPNECGLQKMVCTTIRKTRICYDGTNTWEGLASLVADYFNYEPLSKPMNHPERIMSPYTCIIRRSGNPFEIAHVLVSWLTGSGFDAYVVVGCAKRDTCMGIRYRIECPDIPDENPKVEKEEAPEEEPRYRLMPLPDFTSQYAVMMEQRAKKEKQDEIDKIENERKARIAELELPPHDPIDGWRTHAWVLILPGFGGVEEPFFIEPSEGNAYPLSAPQYQYIDSVYNHENYYANIQKLEEGEDLSHMNYELFDLNYWEHLLPGEPYHKRNMVGVDPTDDRTVCETEKHLDMPHSWVEKLEISAEDFEQRYPGSHKRIHYKKCILEKFARYSERDGVIKRIQTYDDYAMTKPLMTYEFYNNRIDNMDTRKLNHVKQEITETFLEGRPDHLIKHTYRMNTPAVVVESHRTLEFNWYRRNDHLTTVVCTPLTFEERYTNREDKLESRYIKYKEGTKAEPKRKMHTITETFARNYNKPAKDDIWTRVFKMAENKIEILYHYEYNFVTNDTRYFIKPNLTETGGRILFDPDKTSGYIADPNAPGPRALNVYYTLCDSMSAEYATNKEIRDREIDINSYLKQRIKELTDPKLFVYLFNTESNFEAQKGWQEQETQKAQMAEREKEAEIDPLAPYLARMFGSGQGPDRPLTVKEATLVREQCINDYKNMQLARQILVQDRYEALNTEYKNKRLWYLANQFILTPEKESAYFDVSSKLAFQVHNLEVRLTRHKDLSGPRYKTLIDYLAKHPLLKEYNKAKSIHRSRPGN